MCIPSCKVWQLLTFLLTLLIGVGETSEGEKGKTKYASPPSMNVMVDVVPAQPHAGTSLASSLGAVMKSVGRPDWSLAKLQGVMGHAFQFEMKKGGKWVFHDNLDWGVAINQLSHIAKFKTFEAVLRDSIDETTLLTLQRRAKEAVVVGLLRGYPAMVWSPLSAEMKAGAPPHPVCWGLIVGYNKEEETYTIRHPWVSKTYTVRYDAIGPANHNTWFCVKVFEGNSDSDERQVHLAALYNGVAFAKGTRYEEGTKNRSRPQGFVAYELWREAFESVDVPLKAAHHHVDMLGRKREAAADYLRELSKMFPVASEHFDMAIDHYGQELQSIKLLHDICHEVEKEKKISDAERAKARSLIGSALEAERKAIESIEDALALIQ